MLAVPENQQLSSVAESPHKYVLPCECTVCCRLLYLLKFQSNTRYTWFDTRAPAQSLSSSRQAPLALIDAFSVFHPNFPRLLISAFPVIQEAQRQSPFPSNKAVSLLIQGDRPMRNQRAHRRCPSRSSYCRRNPPFQAWADTAAASQLLGMLSAPPKTISPMHKNLAVRRHQPNERRWHFLPVSTTHALANTKIMRHASGSNTSPPGLFC